MDTIPYEEFFRDSPDFLAIIDRDLRIVMCNWKGGYEYISRENRQKNSPCHDIFHPGQGRPCRNCPALEVFRTGKPLFTEKLHPRLGPLEVRCFPIFDDHGGLIMVGEQIRRIGLSKRVEKNLRHSEQRFVRLHQAMPVAIQVLDQDGFLLEVNQAWLETLGYGRDEVIGRNFANFLSVEYRPSFKVFLSRLKNAGKTSGAVFQIRKKDGSLVYMRIEGRFSSYWKDMAPQAQCLMLDVTEQHRAEEAIRTSELRYRTLMETANDAIFLAESDTGKIVDANRRAEDLIGVPLAEIRRLHITDLHPVEDKPFYKELFRKILIQKTLVEKDIFLVHRDKNRIPVEISASCFQVGNRKYVQGIYRDVTERIMAENALREQKERLNYLAYHDSLTNLPNRLLLEDRFQQALARASRGGERLAVLFLDLDRFKQINDSLGHERGDRILREMARRLDSSIREGDTVARLGGDEFIVLLEGIHGRRDIAAVAENIMARMAEFHYAEDIDLQVTVSIGISLYPDDGQDMDGLIGRADSAMYSAKRRGKNTFQFFDRATTGHVHDPLVLESGLRNAIEKDQLVLHFQPQWSLSSGRVVGTEALVRWQRPEFGLLAPDRFIPLAEENGLIVPLTEWVLTQACRQNLQWQKRGYPTVPVAVNISARQFLSGDLLPMVAGVLEKTGMKGHWLELEITESMIVENPESAIRTMNQLRKMGVQLAIDDFGTGYSYLGHLKQFPVGKLKIDRSFVRDMLTDENDAIIVDAMIALGRRLNLQVIAEGVETQEQLCFFTEKGCHQVQGFLLGHPQPASEMERLFLVKEEFGTFCRLLSSGPVSRGKK